MEPRREYTAAVVAALAGGGLALVVAQPAWVHVRAVGAAAGGVVLAVDVPGSEAAALVVPLSLVAMAGAFGVLATRGTARVAVGALVALAGTGVAVDALRVLAGPRAAVAGALAHRSVDPQAVAAATYSCSWWWPLLAVLGGVLVATAGAGTAVRARRWPAMGARYDAPRAAAARPGDVWAALDRGEDPTAAEPPVADSRGGDLPE
jgi:uncharacterized membrane protein (TIGR02234 family)